MTTTNSQNHTPDADRLESLLNLIEARASTQEDDPRVRLRGIARLARQARGLLTGEAPSRNDVDQPAMVDDDLTKRVERQRERIFQVRAIIQCAAEKVDAATNDGGDQPAWWALNSAVEQLDDIAEALQG